MANPNTTKRGAALLLAALSLGLPGSATADPEPTRETQLARSASETRHPVKLATLPERDHRCSDFCIARKIPVYVPPNRGSLPMRIGGASRGV